ncbi:macrophage mannose receptor 1-like [Contarinia nasturtii]|uniref:macrophage mannose receptor 1-like n=1 Tax=Contarinia nasturtii TaxID=265458 RepID=UPI0012D477DE|nr:macrophage mannose receptor 1-like [Contarinia nasturtii]
MKLCLVLFISILGIGLSEKFYHIGRWMTGNWYQGNAYCNSINQRLISIMSEQENEKVTKFIKNSGYPLSENSFWTSGTKLGENFIYWMSNGSKIVYKNFVDKKPYNLTVTEAQAEKCVELRGLNDLKWNEVRCDIDLRFVCEIESASRLSIWDTIHNRDNVVKEEN